MPWRVSRATSTCPRGPTPAIIIRRRFASPRCKSPPHQSRQYEDRLRRRPRAHDNAYCRYCSTAAASDRLASPAASPAQAGCLPFYPLEQSYGAS
eukprot:840192-Prorocentrum_minimum.AAC.1